jgi:hypothetical protein
MKNSSNPSQRTLVRRAPWIAAAAVAGPLLFAGCQSLDVTNQNSPLILGVFSDATNLEAALIGGWRDYWGMAQGARTNSTSPFIQLSVFGNELTTADAFPMEVTAEPRPAIDNQDAGGWANRKPWYESYGVIATGRDAIQSIRANNLKLGLVSAEFPDGQDTPRAIVFSKFLIGIGNINLGLLFDQGFPATEDDDPATYDFTTLRPYTELLETGRASLRAAIADAKAAPNFTLPETWINGAPLTRDQFVRVMYAYLVRSYVHEARDPAGRAATDWQRVLTLLDSSITQDFTSQATLDIADTRSTYQQYAYLQTNGRTSNRLIGPADTTGRYQAWLALPTEQRQAIIIGSPDKRISNTTTDAQPAGTRFKRLASQTMTSARGTYMHSNYHSTRYRNPPALNFHSTGRLPIITMDEMKYIRAEALYRLNRRNEVPALLNPTRVAAGLAPVTVDGPPNTPSCVPRRDDGTCGDLWDALMYEKRIDLFPLDAAATFFDQRGWGKLLRGTPLHFPVHGRELETLGLPIYTFGGTGPGSAP